MNKASLIERRTKAESEFNELEKQRVDIITRQTELRGQWALLNEQIDEFDKKPKVSPAADVIDIEAALKEK